MRLNAKDALGNTALMLAVERGHNWTVQVLLRQPEIDVNARDAKGATSLIKISHPK